MIRLITSDIDGTLLQNGATKISNRLFEQVRELRKYGVLFAAASGRQYQSLRTLFEPVKDEMMFIAENGGCIFKDGECIYEDTMQTDALLGLLRDAFLLKGCMMLINGPLKAYVLPEHKALEKILVEDYHMAVEVVERLEDIPETIVKMAVYHPDGAKVSDEYFQARWGDQVKVAISGDYFVDLTSCDKGTGIQAACRTLGIDPSEVMAFGDNYNDIAMLETVGEGYIMSGAVEDLRRRFPNTPTVEGKLDELLEQLRAEQSAQ